MSPLLTRQLPYDLRLIRPDPGATTNQFDPALLESVERYLDGVLENAVGLQRGQELVIDADIAQAPLVRLLTKQAYIRGAKLVTPLWNDSIVDQVHREYGDPKWSAFVPSWKDKRTEHFIASGAAQVQLTGRPLEDLFGVANDKCAWSEACRLWREEGAKAGVANTYFAPELQAAVERYLEMALEIGVGLQRDQELVMGAELFHAPLVRLMAKQAYIRGAKAVTVTWGDPVLDLLQFVHGDREGLTFVPSWVKARTDHNVDSGISRVAFTGTEYPDLLKDVDADLIAESNKAWQAATRRWRDEGVNKGKAQWLVLAVPTLGWAKKVFPEADAVDGYLALWKEVIKACRVDESDWSEKWKAHDALLHERSRKLDELGIESLHFSGPGTNLTVTLSERSVFQGGSEKSASGVAFLANAPTEEVYTSPDWRGTEGIVRVTRPVVINGITVRGLTLTFRAGEVVSFHADEGEAMFEKFLTTDPGAKRLGEVALLGTDSPIYRTGLLFYNTLFDENAACHIAFGDAYVSCIKDGTSASADELESLGVNRSRVHKDVMISSDQVSVTARTRTKGVVPLIERGAWVF